jgi:hypothetical protein
MVLNIHSADMSLIVSTLKKQNVSFKVHQNKNVCKVYSEEKEPLMSLFHFFSKFLGCSMYLTKE